MLALIFVFFIVAAAVLACVSEVDKISKNENVNPHSKDTSGIPFKGHPFEDIHKTQYEDLYFLGSTLDDLTIE